MYKNVTDIMCEFQDKTKGNLLMIFLFTKTAPMHSCQVIYCGQLLKILTVFQNNNLDYLPIIKFASNICEKACLKMKHKNYLDLNYK